MQKNRKIYENKHRIHCKKYAALYYNILIIKYLSLFRSKKLIKVLIYLLTLNFNKILLIKGKVYFLRTLSYLSSL